MNLPLTNGLSALVDEADLPRCLAAGVWHAAKREHTVYAVRHTKKEDGRRGTEYLHRFLLGAGAKDKVDHISCDGLDNRRANLRLCSQSQNLCNARLRSDNASGVKGVCFFPRDKTWQAEIQLSGVRKYLGRFATIEEAAQAIEAARATMHGTYARTK